MATKTNIAKARKASATRKGTPSKASKLSKAGATSKLSKATSKPTPPTVRAPIVLRPGAGRTYPMGPLDAIFKADGDETRGRYSISEWWLEPYTRGPGAHSHDEDDVFYVLEGTISFFVGGEWLDAPKGSLVIAPANTPHDFENRTATRAGMLNVSVPGDFEPEMAGIAPWFRERSAADSRTANAPARSGR